MRRVIASILCVALAAGAAGCDDMGGSKRNMAVIDNLLEEYVEALNAFSADRVLDLTDWDSDDKEYVETEELLSPNTYRRDYGEKAVDICKGMASTITLDYESDDLEFKDGKASLKVTYTIADWDRIYIDARYNVDDAISNIGDAKDKLTVKGRLGFALTDGGWKISRITELGEVFRFTGSFENVFMEPDPIDIEPTTTSPTEPDIVETSSSRIYAEAIDSYIWELTQKKDGIKKIENVFFIDAAGIYDIDGDGIPEIYYITEHTPDYSGMFVIGSYNDFSGEVFELVSIPDIIYQAQGGGFYIIYATDKELVLTYSHGEEALYHVESEVYSLETWTHLVHYRRDVYYEYNPYTDTEVYTYEYFMNDDVQISPEEYNKVFNDLVGRTNVVIDSNYTPLTEDVESPLAVKPKVGMLGYDRTLEYLNSLK